MPVSSDDSQDLVLLIRAEDLEHSWAVRLAGEWIAFAPGVAVYAAMPEPGSNGSGDPAQPQGARLQRSAAALRHGVVR